MRFRPLFAAAVLATAGLVAPATPAFAAADTSVPQIVETALSPGTTSLNYAPVTLTARAHLTDESGVVTPQLELFHDNTDASAGRSYGTLISGTAQDGTWAFTWTLDSAAPAGTWSARFTFLADTLGNSRKEGAYEFGFIQLLPATQPGVHYVNISGKVAYGRTVQVFAGSEEWRPLAYQWYLDGVAVEGATTKKYRIPNDVIGSMLTATVTLSDGANTEVVTAPGYWVRGKVQQGKVSIDGPGSRALGADLVLSMRGFPDTATQTIEWLVDGQPTGKTGTTFALQDAVLVGKYISARVSSRAPLYETQVVTTDLVRVVSPPVVPALSPGAFSLKGEPKVGSTLTASITGATPGATMTYQWMRNGTPIAGAVNAQYALTPADLGAAVYVSYTVSKPGYLPFSDSPPGYKIGAGTQKAGTITVSGTATTGSTLTAKAAGWPTGSKLAFAWLRDGKAISGATSATSKLTPADFSRRIQVKATSSLTGYGTATLESATVTPKASSLASGTVTFTGTAKTGSTLTAKTTAWPAGSKLAYAWLRDGKTISGATKTTYKLTASDTGKKISLKVTAILTAYTIPAKTSRASVVAKGTQAAGKVVITGTAKPGKKMTAKTSAFQAGTKLSYAWLRNGKAIKGATKSTYTLTKSDASKKLTVKVTAKLAGYNDRAVTSAAKTIAKR